MMYGTGPTDVPGSSVATGCSSSSQQQAEARAGAAARSSSASALNLGGTQLARRSGHSKPRASSGPFGRPRCRTAGTLGSWQQSVYDPVAFTATPL